MKTLLVELGCRLPWAWRQAYARLIARLWKGFRDV